MSMQDLFELHCEYLRKRIEDSGAGLRRLALKDALANFCRERAAIRCGEIHSDWKAGKLSNEEARDDFRAVEHGLGQDGLRNPDNFGHLFREIRDALLREGRGAPKRDRQNH